MCLSLKIALKHLLSGKHQFHKTPYNTKLWINDKRNIDKVSCTCVYGQSSKCKHVAAVIYFINNDQSITKTSEEKEWGVPSARLFATEKYSKGRSCEQMFMCKNKCFEEPISLKPPVKSSQLKAHSVLRSTLLKAEQDKCEVAVALVMENLLNQVEENVLYNEARGPISDILKVFFNSIEGQDVYVTNYDLDDNLKKIYDEKIFKTDNQIVNVCCETIKQSTCPTWFNERRLRLTASKDVHSIKTRRTKTVESLVKDLLKPNNFSVASTRYGQVNEPIARKIYEKCFKCEIKCVGLIISKKNPWLGVSLDGVAVKDGIVIKIVEIKCPSTCEKVCIIDIKNKKSNLKYLIFEGNKVVLRKSHEYYTQIQVQMYATGMNECDLFVYSPMGNVVVNVKRDNMFLKEVIPKCEFFYFKYYLPALFSIDNN